MPSGTYRNITGNPALSLGLVAGAHRAGRPLVLGSYPITPASDILHELSKLKQFDVTTFQAEDEIAGIGAVVGGGANLAMSRAVVKSTQEAFGPLPASFPPELSEVDRAPKLADDARDRSKESEKAGEPAQISGEGQQDS